MTSFLTGFRQIFNGTGRILPTTCLLCADSLWGELLCDECQLHLPHLTSRSCDQCSLPLSGDGRFCGHCLYHPPAFTHSVIPFSYRHPLDYLIRSFKYHRNLTAGRALAQLLATRIHHQYHEQQWPWPEWIIPVPVHWTRRWQRGFNQAEIISNELSRQLNIPQLSRLCRRQSQTQSQKGLGRAARQKNLRRAFTIAMPADDIRGKCVALLDDVVTTTATARELSHLLIKAGAAEVHVWALARTPEPGDD